eukprot:TRINITY_DN50818_c0_g1_i1.p1 TRINITY_DN50818_c0_g1~~TRINITY_DN50818_c0_g1_i1.p1  ORF type:complete len:357 (+),score=146.18 TRINITY_DN50818_c0_g1_i1:92-1072(+)
MLYGAAVIALQLGAAYLGWMIGGFLLAVCFLAGFSYLAHQLLLAALPAQDLKAKYGAQWALVTGGSSGIGRAVAQRLLQQGIDVVIVSLPEPILDETCAALQKQFPERKVKSIAVNLGSPGQYMDTITKETADLPISLVFCNAGFVMTGFCHKTPADRQMANLECNAVSAFQLARHFVGIMVDKKLKGCVVFTSSPAMCMPSPFTALYSSTKAFVSTFAASLAGEVKSHGIDVLAVHPSPVASRFYEGGGNGALHQLDAIDFFKKFAVTPESLPDRIFAAIGRTVWLDIGATAIGFRLAMKVLDYNCFATMVANVAHLMGDYRRHA